MFQKNLSIIIFLSTFDAIRGSNINWKVMFHKKKPN